MTQDLYQTLGVDRTASPDAIKKAFKKLAKDLHPDRNPNNPTAAERFKEVGSAYDVLSDAEKRRLYDEFGEDALRTGFDAEQARAAKAFRGRGGFGQGPGGFGGGFVDLSELFGAGGFGGGFRGPARGPDLEARLTLPFLEAARGGVHSLDLGHGPVRVRIPAGTEDGDRIRIPGQGGASRSGPPGDLLVAVSVLADPRFRVEERDLVTPLLVTVPEAIRGVKAEVPTLEGRVLVSVPAGVSSGRRLRIPGRGLPGRRGAPAGDLLAEIRIVLPELPPGDDRAARAAELLAGLYRGDVRES